MPEWLIFAIKFCTNEVPKLLKRHLSRTIVITSVLTLTIQWIIIGPWGSDKIRQIFLSSILSNEEDRSQAGYFTEADASIIDRWRDMVSTGGYSDDFKDNPTALQLARYKSQHAIAPFQPIGTEVTVSSPDCSAHRPGFGLAFMNMERNDLREQGWKPGQIVKFTSQDGRGEPVVAQLIAPNVAMPRNIQFHLNREQYKMLRQWEPIALVNVVASNGKISQASDDLLPDVAAAKCPTGPAK